MWILKRLHSLLHILPTCAPTQQPQSLPHVTGVSKSTKKTSKRKKEYINPENRPEKYAMYNQITAFPPPPLPRFGPSSSVLIALSIPNQVAKTPHIPTTFFLAHIQ